MTSRTERILVIDRQVESRHALDRILQAKGYYVNAVDDVNRALDVLAHNPPDLIFADLTPASLISLSARLRSDPLHPAPPIVACTAVDAANEAVALLRAGASDVLLKPFDDRSALDDVLEKLFERVRLARLNATYRAELEEANKELRAGIAELRADQRAGRKVQMRMLPEPDRQINGLYLDRLVMPSLYLSGDFLDYFRLDDERTLVYLADVSGHGASSAFVTVLLKNLTNRLQRNLRRSSSDDVLYPDRFLQRVNTELLETGLGKHLTSFVGIIDNTRRTLTYSVAAHFPLPILAGPQGAEYLEGSGMPIGLFEEPSWEVREVALPTPFTLVLFSDGILEVMPQASLDKKEAHLLELVSAGRHTIASLSEAFGLGEMSELPDDIAIMTVTDRAVTDHV
ncbi:MAG: response regulator [Gammaproteobacteria bacterium]|nr:response regulator [Gammaproteobacteria bacterium]